MVCNRITGSSDFFHRPVFLRVETKGEKIPTQLGPLEEGRKSSSD
jgi:hypothetical protein